MRKVLHVSAAAQRGGLEVVLLNVLKALDRSRFSPQVLLLEDGPFVKEVEGTGTETHVIQAGRLREVIRAARSVAGITRLIRSQRIDIVHTWNAKAHIYGGLAAFIARVPSLYHLQGVPRFTMTRDGVVSLMSVAVPARRTVACSAYVKEAFRRAWRSRRDIAVVHNGVVPESNGASSTPSVREEFGIPQGSPLVIMATRLQRWKGVHVFLDAAADVVRVHPDARFMVVGGALFGLDEEYGLQLHRQVDRANLSNAVRLTGFRGDVHRFFMAADVVVHASIQPEPFGMVLVEAMACGKPVIASSSGGPQEIVETGVTGLLVSPGDTKALTAAIVGLLDDPERRVRMGRAGAARVRNRFTARRMVDQLQDTYLGMIRETPLR